jgi:hypothetical protein
MKYDQFAQAYLSMLTESTQLLSEEMLMEDRIDYLKKNTKVINSSHDTFAAHRDTSDIIDFLANHADPSKKKVYTQHLIKMYHNGAFRQEDAPRVHDALNNFDKYRSKLPEDQRDITKYSKISEIQAAVAPHLGTGATKAESREILRNNPNIPGKHELKYDDEHISLYHVNDKETSQKMYGATTERIVGAFPTEWCTAWSGVPGSGKRECRYDAYRKDGNIFAVHRKSDGALFQYHPATDQFMDVNDDPISKEDFESLKPSLHKAWIKDRSLLDL